MPNTKIDPSQNPILKKYKLDEMLKEHKTYSAVMRYLSSEGYARADIARFTGKIYQHVKNVLDAQIQKEKDQAEREAAAKAAEQKSTPRKPATSRAKK